MIRLITAGESHGPCLTVILEGMPSGVPIRIDAVQEDLSRRQQGYGRGDRMKIETDQAQIVGGVRHGFSLGSPIALRIDNRDWVNWQQEMNSQPVEAWETQRAVHQPRPGHADLAGMIKYRHQDMRNILERASARETAARVAAGALLKQFLEAFDISIFSHTVRVGNVEAGTDAQKLPEPKALRRCNLTPMRCLNPDAEKRMMQAIDQAKEHGDTLGGIFEVIAFRVPAGLGSHTQWDRKLDGRIAQAFLSIPGVKAMEIGDGVRNAGRPGSEVHDAIYYHKSSRGFYRRTNRCGGLEGGITNGMPVQVRGFMKPISTLLKPLTSVDIRTKARKDAVYERSDVSVVPAAGTVGEAMLAFVLADAFLEKFGGDSMEEIRNNYQSHLSWLQKI